MGRSEDQVICRDRALASGYDALLIGRIPAYLAICQPQQIERNQRHALPALFDHDHACIEWLAYALKGRPALLHR